MTAAGSPIAVNRLLEQLPSRQRRRILRTCERVDLEFGEVLCESHRAFTHVYFPLTGFISLLAPMDGHEPLEMGLIGNEGMLGATLALGVDDAGLRAVVQGAGTALRMSARQLRAELAIDPALHRLLNRYLYVLMAQLAQAATCTHFHDVNARLARWLLMTHDRAHGDSFHLTHQFLADMLGVRRSAVSIAAHALQESKVIRYSRGEITVLIRNKLEAASCACYGILRDQHAELLEGSGR